MRTQPLIITQILFLGIFPLHAEEGKTSSNPFVSFFNQTIHGIIESDFRELQIDELLPAEQMTLPRVNLPREMDHPRLLFNETQADLINARQFSGVYAEWADQIIETANRLSPRSDAPFLNEIERSRKIKVLAFAWFLTSDSTCLDEAIQGISAIREPGPIHSIEGGKADAGWGDWVQAAETVRHFAVAYDLLYHDLPVEARKSFESKLALQVLQMSRHASWIPKNNHAVVIGAALSTAALVLDHPESQRWMDAGLALMKAGLHMIEPDGTCREGAYYARFILSEIVPFAFYLKNVTGINLLHNPRIERLFLWLNALEKPDGSVPLFDDAFPENFLFAPVAIGLLDEPDALNASFINHSDRFKADDPDWVEAFCAYPPWRTSVPPAKPVSDFFPDGGMAVFKSETCYGLFLGEKGRPHLSGHDHAEPGAFTLSAFGKDFLLDAGYGSGGTTNPDRLWFVSPAAHNIPLVDGQGPDQNPVFGDDLGGKLENLFAMEGFAASTVTSHYRDARFRRDVWFAGDRYFLVLDQTDAGEDADISFPWHGRGDFYRSRPNAFQWTQEDVILESEILTPDERILAISEERGLDTFSGESFHTTAVIHARGGENGLLATLMIPQQAGDPVFIRPMVVISEKPASARAISLPDGRTDLVVSAQTAWTCGRLRSDARLALMQLDENQNSILSLKNASFAILDGRTIFQSTEPVDIFLNCQTDSWAGYINAESAYSDSLILNLLPLFDPGTILFNKFPVDYETAGDTIRFVIRESGPLQLGLSANGIRTPESWRPSLPLLTRLSRSGDLNSTLQHLTEAEITQLRNEIIFLLGKKGLEGADRFFGEHALENLYELVCGLINFSANQSGAESFAIPQTWEMDKNIGSHQVGYKTSGFWSEKGLTLREHRLQVDTLLSYALRKPFEGRTSQQLSLHQSGQDLLITTDRIRSQTAWQGLFTRWLPEGWMQVDYTDSYSDISSSSLSWRHRQWMSRVSLSDPSGIKEMQLMSGVQTASSASSVGIEMKQDGIRRVRLTHAQQLNPYCSMDLLIDEKQEAVLNHSVMETGILFAREFLQGSARLRNIREHWDGFWSAGAHWNGWHLTGKGSYRDQFKGEMVLARRLRKLSWQTSCNFRDNAEWMIIFRPRPVYGMHVKNRWHYSDGSLGMLGGGVTVSKGFLIGGDVQWETLKHEDWLVYSGNVGFYLPRRERIQLSLSAMQNLDSDKKQVELRIDQRGKTRTPGLLIRSDENGVQRFEGFLEWIF